MGLTDLNNKDQNKKDQIKINQDRTNQDKLFSFKPCCDTGINHDNGFMAGGHQEICLRPGLWLTMINFFSDTPVYLEYEKHYPVIDFGFVISGSIRSRTIRADRRQKQTRMQNGLSGVRLASRQTGTVTIPGDSRQQILHLHMTLPFFRSLLKKDDTVLLPGTMRAILKGATQIEFEDIRPMTPDIQTVVYQLLNTSGNAFPWPLYLEGKSLELLCLHLAALGLDHCRPSGTQRLNPDEKQKILKARNLLVLDLQSPPSVDTLSKITCMTSAKLQAGFRQVYGKSVFDYFREYRMQKAMQLFDETRTNVSQTAWQIGYTNVSHFSEAFKKRFGILPKQYLKKQIRNLNW